MSNSLTRSDTDYMRECVQELVQNGATKHSIKELRRTLADLFGCSIQQVAAATAWKTADDGSLSLGHVASSSIDRVPDFDPASDIEVKDNGGDVFDYGNEKKEKWRLQWMDYVRAATTPAERATMKVLTLPGRDCIEIPKYLELGFSPENIVGVEGSHRVRDEFLRNANAYGIQAKVGDLTKVLEDDDTPYGMINLDFLGPMCDKYLHIAHMIKTADRAVVVVNAMARREPSGIQRYMRMMESVIRPKEHVARLSPSEIMNIHHRGCDEAARNPIDLAKARDAAASFSFITSLGVEKCTGKWYERAKALMPIPRGLEYDFDAVGGPRTLDEREMEYSRLFELFTRLSGHCFDPLQRLLESGFPRSIAQKMAINANGLLLQASFDGFAIRNLQHYRYHSVPSGTPYDSAFCTVERPSAFYNNARHTIEFLTQMMGAFLRTEQNSFIRLRTKDRLVPVVDRPFSSSDRLCLETPQKILTSIQLHSFVNDVASYSCAFEGNELNKPWDDDASPTRTLIE